MADPAHTTATTEVAGHAPAEHAEPTALGLEPTGWVALAMLAVFAVFLWARVPRAVAKALDQRIEGIRKRLEEASSLRADAEALKKEYQKKAKAADKEAKAMIERAGHEAEAIVAKANSDAEAMIERRTRMAEEKIAAEERAAVEQLRATAAEAARSAAARLISEQLDEKTDERLVNEAIGGIGR